MCPCVCKLVLCVSTYTSASVCAYVCIYVYAEAGLGPAQVCLCPIGSPCQDVKDGRRVELRLYNDGTKPERPVRVSVKRSDGDESVFEFDSMAHAYIYLKRTHQRDALDYFLHQALDNNPNLQHEQF